MSKPRARRGLAIALALLGGMATLGAMDVRDLLGKEELWQSSADSFMRSATGRHFRWLSPTARDVARCPPGRPLKGFGMKLWEAFARFEDGHLRSLDISLYNRGDAGEISEEAFTGLLTTIRERLEAHAGGKGDPLPDQRLAGRARIARHLWIKGPDQFILKWSSTETGRREGFRAEYVQLEISLYDSRNDPRKVRESAITQSRAGMLTPDELLAKVARRDDGTVFIADVPMVDQGQKGYCVVATTERILRHYGTEVDQHMLAQLASSSAEGGTNPVYMLEMLKKAGVRFGVRVNTLSGFDFRKQYAEQREYLRFAERSGANPQSPDTYREFRVERKKRDYRRFLRDIRKYVEQGVPLAWSVQLGLFPEPGLPQVAGGHMRLIIGYNDGTEQIIFSDSWGPRHAHKAMPMEQAWTITTGLAVMTTRKTDQ